MNVLFSFVEMFVNKVHIYNMSLMRYFWTWQHGTSYSLLQTLLL